MAKLIKLNVQNFKRIQAVEIEPTGNLTIVGGMNEQGKSSLLDSISVLLQGKTTKIPEPVRKGTKKATITGEIQKDEWDAFDDMIITRTITAAGNWYVKVQDKNGRAYKSPEGMLKEIFGEPLDPVEFVRMSPAERVETLKRITGLDFSKLDARRKEFYDDRTLVGREVKQIEGSIKGFEAYYPDVPEEKVSVTALLEKLGKRQAVNRANGDKKKNLKDLNVDIRTGEKVILDSEKGIKQLQEKLQISKDLLNNYILKKSALEDEINNLKDTDEQEIKDQIAKVEETNTKIDSNVKFDKETEKLEQKKYAYQMLTSKLQKIEDDKQSQLSKIDFPVDGLSFNENDVLYNDLPFNEKQLSSEELLRVSFAIAIAARPNLKNILIREGSLLDENNLKLIGKMAEDAGIHVFVEVVSDGTYGKATIIIENGVVKESGIEEDDFADI